MRALALLLLVGSPAHAGVFGDGVAGLGGSADGPHTRLGLRAGIGDRYALLVAADWSHWTDEAEDHERIEDRYRSTASVALRTHERRVMFRAGIGYELVHAVDGGYSFSMHEWVSHTEVHHAGVFEVGAAAFLDADSYQLGLELAAGFSTYEGGYGELLVVVRFGS